MHKQSLSIVIPAYNEANRIENTLQSIVRYFAGAPPNSFEVIVVDDGSTDGTPEIVERYTSKIQHMQIMRNNQNEGKGFSVRRGMLAARGDYRLFMDADNSVDISHLGVFIHEILNGFDVVIGSIHLNNKSKVSEHSGWHRRALGATANLLIQFVAVRGIKDTQRGFKLFSAEAAEVVFRGQTIQRFGFDIENLILARKNGFKIKEVPVAWDNPAGSKVTAASYVQTLIELARISYNRMRGRYMVRTEPAPHSAAGNLARENTNSSIYERARRFFFGQEHDPHFSPIVSEGKQTGFHYKGNEFIHHANLHITESAFFNLLRHQKILLGIVGGFLAFAFFINWKVTAIVLFGVMTGLYFLDLVFSAFIIFKSYKTLPEIHISEKEVAMLRDEDCPTYTIFCPLYKEWRVVPQFVDAMQKLDYPHDKLQIRWYGTRAYLYENLQFKVL